ncbi:hypothetical protein [Nocardia sp. NPDC051463]|uniref:hypothetical protein n=1 Tax=Nocardia sp. NPDC051463 TaxID=3154845 RepID=UPI00344B6CA3
MLLPDKPFKTLTDADLDALKARTGVLEVYGPKVDVSTTTVGARSSLDLTRVADPYRALTSDVQVHNPHDAPSWWRYGTDENYYQQNANPAYLPHQELYERDGELKWSEGYSADPDADLSYAPLPPREGE